MSLAPPRGKRGRGVATVGRQPGLRHPDLDNLDDLDWGSDDGLPPAAAVAEPVNRGQEGLRDQAGGQSTGGKMGHSQKLFVLDNVVKRVVVRQQYRKGLSPKSFVLDYAVRPVLVE